MKVQKVSDYQAMSIAGADIIYNAVVSALKQGKNFNLGLATGNTMIELYRILAERFNADGIDLSRLQTWNLDEYASDSSHAVPHDHPLSYCKYMHENLFNRFEDEEWLKTNLGMKISTNGNTVVYSFTPKLDKLAEAIVVEFKPAIINEEDYNELLDELHDSFNGYSDEEFKFNVTMTITDGIFTGLRAEFEADGQNLYMEYSISKINATTFDTEALTLLKGNAHMLEMDELFGSSVEDEAVSNRVDVMA